MSSIPISGIDRASDDSASDRETVARLLPELELIGSAELRARVVEIWVECWRESAWAAPDQAPKSPLEPRGASLVTHTRGVTRQALASAEIAFEVHGVGYDRDLLIAGGLLHDVTKLVEWGPAPGGAAATARGALVQHAVYGAHKAWQKGLPDELVHVIVSHSDQSAMRPATWECALVRAADLIDSEALHRAAASRAGLPRPGPSARSPWTSAAARGRWRAATARPSSSRSTTGSSTASTRARRPGWRSPAAVPTGRPREGTARSTWRRTEASRRPGPGRS
jgi:putative nucleotidyltransferase with HDIG domain